jgi:hypothetical protein
MNIKLTSNNATETRVLEYLQENASDVLAEKINAGNKTLAGALEHAKGEAKKLAGGEPCVCVDDATVFGWIIHYFEEESITEKAKPGPRLPGGVAKKAAPKKTQAVKPKPGPAPAVKSGPVLEQPTMFEALFGGAKA